MARCHLARPLVRLALVLAVAGPLPVRAAPPSPPVSPGGASALRPASPPTPLERARVRRWLEVWQEEAAPLETAFSEALRSLEAESHGGLRPRCVELAGALLELDRARVLPAPDRAADLHLRRGLHQLARAAVTCLTERPYAARDALRRAAEAFRQARRVLRRYRQKPASVPSARGSSAQGR